MPNVDGPFCILKRNTMKSATSPITTAIRDIGADRNAGKDLSLIEAWHHGRRDAALDAAVAANRVWTIGHPNCGAEKHCGCGRAEHLGQNAIIAASSAKRLPANNHSFVEGARGGQ
jgi:hypothetical protein